jgi:hypothetical protein
LLVYGFGVTLGGIIAYKIIWAQPLSKNKKSWLDNTAYMFLGAGSLMVKYIFYMYIRLVYLQDFI